jgi:excisionase family DNA binding protein
MLRPGTTYPIFARHRRSRGPGEFLTSLVAHERSAAPFPSMNEPRTDITDANVARRRRDAAASDGEMVARSKDGRRLLSPAELASYLAIPLATVYRWRSRREGPCGIRVGRHVRYRLDDVERWLDEMREQRP